MASHNIATLYFPSSNLSAYFSGKAKMEFLFSDSKFGERKLMEHIFFDLDNKLRESNMKLGFEKRNTLTGVGWTITLLKETPDKIQLSELWTTQIMYALLAKMSGLGYVLNHTTEAGTTRSYYFKEAFQVDIQLDLLPYM